MGASAVSCSTSAAPRVLGRIHAVWKGRVGVDRASHSSRPLNSAGADPSGRLEGQGVTHETVRPFAVPGHSDESNTKEKELDGAGHDFEIWLPKNPV